MCIRFMSGNRPPARRAYASERRSRKGLLFSPEDSPAGEGQGRNSGVYTSEKSDRPIVPEKLSNKAPSIIDTMTTELRR